MSGSIRVAGRRFVAGTTEATRRPEAVSLSDGFEASPETEVTRDTQDRELPGSIVFVTTPESVIAGERYRVEIFLLNRGRAPIEIDELLITATVNDKKSHGAVPPRTKSVAPGERSLLVSLSDFMREDARSWPLDVLVKHTRGDSYRSQLAWK